MKAIFLSDAHLRSKDDPRYRKLLSFLEGLKGRVNRLYLAGDFFDFWFCSDRRIYPDYIPVIEKLLDLRRAGAEILLCEGNHDFYLESYFRGRLGLRVCEEWAELELDGRKILLSHGDTVDRSNTRYLFLRRVLRSRLFSRFQWCIPSVLRWRLASLSSDISKGFSEASKDRLVATMESFAQSKFREGYDAVILGHSHRPLLRTSLVGGRERTFASLGDWVEHYSYLVCENGRFDLRFFVS